MDEDGSVCVFVFVHGPVIAAPVLAHIFDSFFSIKNAGIGIDLTICPLIIGAHGGSIWRANSQNGAHNFASYFLRRRLQVRVQNRHTRSPSGPTSGIGASRNDQLRAR